MANRDGRIVTLPSSTSWLRGSNARFAMRRTLVTAAKSCKSTSQRTHSVINQVRGSGWRRTAPGGKMCEICRRHFIGGAVAIGLAGASGVLSPPLRAQTPRGDSATRLPARGEFTITNAYVMTMEPNFGDFTGGAVHVKDGEIVAIGHGVSGG